MHCRRHRAALLGERSSVFGTQDLVGVAVWRRPVCGAMVHRQTSESPKALNIGQGLISAGGPGMFDTIITHCLATLIVRIGHKQELWVGLSRLFLGVFLLLKIVIKSAIRHKGAWPHTYEDVRTAFER